MTSKHFAEFNLSREVSQALHELGYLRPTNVQQKVLPVALEDNDLIVQSQTGSGKTAAFSIPITELVEWEENKPQALILTPTRELAAQIRDEITNIGRYKRIKALAIFGKQPFDKQKLALKQKTHVVVGTPGRTLDHLQKGTFPVSRLKYLIIDEADEMLNMGFIEQVEAIIEELPADRVTSLYSATLPEDVASLCEKYMKEPVRINVSEKQGKVDAIEQSLMLVTESEKFSLLQKVTVSENPDSCIVFCGTQEKVDKVFEQMRRARYSCEKMHGALAQKDRFSVMDDFKRGKFRYLIATNVAARGIHIEDVNLIINYDFPLEKESYVHRTGRTGRAGKTGKAITFVAPREEKFISELEQYLDFSIPIVDPPADQTVANNKQDFEMKMRTKPEIKKDPSSSLNKHIMKLYFNGGKKKKLRPVDFVGTITSIEGVTGEDIGIITMEELATYVEILHDKGEYVLQEMKKKTIKGKQLKVHKARN